MQLRIGQGYDLHRLVDGHKLILGGINIPYSKGFLAHSDGDLLLHAICDALIGALALGDIGKLFPDTDPQYRGISSIHLLNQVYLYCKNLGFELINLDATVVIEQPKLNSYIDAIKNNIAQILKSDSKRINIKAKTSEGIGEIGKSLAAEAYVVLILSHQSSLQT